MVSKRTVSNRGIRAKLREHIEKHPGVQLFVGEIASALGGGITEMDIQNAVSNLLRDVPDYPLTVEIRGRSWRYQPGAVAKQATSKRVFEELAETKGGDVIITDQDGRLYRAKELE